MLVYTALLNCEYQDGAPCGNGACACWRSSVSSSSACGTLPDLASSSRPDRRIGSGNPEMTLDGPSRPAQMAWFLASVNHLMNVAAAAGFLAVVGIPMPSGFATFGAAPVAPGVGTYSTWFTTLDELGTS